RSLRAQQRVQYRFVDLGWAEICREGRDSRFSARRHLRTRACSMQPKRSVWRLPAEIKASCDLGRLAQLIDCASGGKAWVLIEPLRHHQFGSRTEAAFAVHLDCDMNEHLRRLVHSHRPEPERMLEWH